MPSVLISPSEEDHRYFTNVFESLGRKLYISRTRREAGQFLGVPALNLVLCEAVLADGGWRDVLGDTKSREPAPRLVVISRLADERMWAEVLNLGGYDLLTKPFDAGEVVRVLNSAWHHRPAPRRPRRGRAA